MQPSSTPPSSSHLPLRSRPETRRSARMLSAAEAANQAARSAARPAPASPDPLPRLTAVLSSPAAAAMARSARRFTIKSPPPASAPADQPRAAAAAAAAPAGAADVIDLSMDCSPALPSEMEATACAEAQAAALPGSSVARAPSTHRSLPLPFPHSRPSSRSNIVQQLLLRQVRTTSLTPLSFLRSTRPHRFGRIQLQRSIDTFEKPSGRDLAILGNHRRSKVSEIVSAGSYVFALTHAGICIAYHTRTLERLCFLNVIADEVIRSLFYNKVNKSIITVSVYRHDHFTSLRCRSTPLEAVGARRPEQGISLFTSEALQWPGFVEFDDVNKKVLTFSASTSLYKVWDLSDYRLLYQLQDRSITEVKISPGIMLLIHNREKSHVPLQVLCIESGEKLCSFHQPLYKNKKVEFIEQFNEMLLVKQKHRPLHLIDIAHHFRRVELPEEKFPTPTAFIFLYENYLYLTFIKREIGVWDFAGRKVASFDQHDNYYPDCNTSNIYINQAQDLLISYCLTRAQSRAMRNRYANSERAERWKRVKDGVGCVAISNIFTGKCIAKIETMKRLKYPLALLTPEQQEHVSLQRARMEEFDEEHEEEEERARMPSQPAASIYETWATLLGLPREALHKFADQLKNPPPGAEEQTKEFVQQLREEVELLQRGNRAQSASPVEKMLNSELPELPPMPSPPMAPASPTLPAVSALPSSPCPDSPDLESFDDGTFCTESSQSSLSSSPRPSSWSGTFQLDSLLKEIDEDTFLDTESEGEEEEDDEDWYSSQEEDEDEDDEDDMWNNSDEETEGQENRTEAETDTDMTSVAEAQPRAAAGTAPAASSPSASAPAPPPPPPEVHFYQVLFPDEELAARRKALRKALTKRRYRERQRKGLPQPDAVKNANHPLPPPLPQAHTLQPYWPLKNLEDYRRYNAYVSKHNRALNGITAVFYNEDNNQIYTGNKKGFLNVWSS